MDCFNKSIYGWWPTCRIILFAGLVIVVFLLTGCAEDSVKELTVNSIEDTGEGSLRWALQEIENGGTISFDLQVFPQDNPATISLKSDLPNITKNNITIDASNAGVIIDGSNSGGNGLTIASDNNLIKGLQIINFNNGSGIVISAEASNNEIGPMNIIVGNGLYGIVASEGAAGNKITANSIHHNGSAGIMIKDQQNKLKAPEISMADLGNGLVQGKTDAGVTVEIFSDTSGQGEFYEGEVQADEKGNFIFAPGNPFIGPRLTAVAIDENGNTSEFSYPTDVREILVASDADHGEGTLRWALENAQTGDYITFDPALFKPDAPHIISLSEGLPPIVQNFIVIDASNAGVIIDGNNAPGEWVVGFEIFSDNVIIQGLQIVNFSGAGIKINGSCNTIGGDRSTGAGPLGQGNLISGNADGIAIDGSNALENQVCGNLIGTDISGQENRGNRVAGIFIDGPASHNKIGPENVIAYNDVGVEVRNPKALANTITENSIFGHETEGIAMTVSADNDLQSPVVLECDIEGGFVTGVAEPNSIVEMFSDNNREGKVFEGYAEANERGAFSFSKGSAFTGPFITTTATRQTGTTSIFSFPIANTGKERIIQEGNTGLKSLIVAYPSNELSGNRIGGLWDGIWHHEWRNIIFSEIVPVGLKHVRTSITGITWDAADFSKPENIIDPVGDEHISTLVENGVTITYVLTFYDLEWRNGGPPVTCPRFKTEEEIERYLNFVKNTVNALKDRVDYFEIFNESDHTWDAGNREPCNQAIDVQDYLELTRRAIPVIRQEHPGAKIVVGSTMTQAEKGSREYLHAILSSDVMPLVDVVAWHPGGPTLEYPYWRENYLKYPDLVREIKDIAEANGFIGEYFADEMVWWTEEDYPQNEPWTYSDIVSAKYFARYIILHLGMDVATNPGGISQSRITQLNTIKYLCTVMDNHKAIEMVVDIDVDYEPIAYSAFRYPNGDRIFAFWTHGIASEADVGVPADIKFPGLAAGSVTGIDVLHGIEQELNFSVVDGTTVVPNMLAKDYPILIRLSNPIMNSDYKEYEGDGFKLIGTPGTLRKTAE